MRRLLGAVRSRMFVIATGAAFVSCLVLVGVASEQATPSTRPNIVLMFPDNLG